MAPRDQALICPLEGQKYDRQLRSDGCHLGSSDGIYQGRRDQCWQDVRVAVTWTNRGDLPENESTEVLLHPPYPVHERDGKNPQYSSFKLYIQVHP